MRRVLTILLFVLCASCAGQPLTYISRPTETMPHYVDVIIMLGQSNAVGQNGSPVTAGLPSDYIGSQSNIKIWWEGTYNAAISPGHFENMNVGVNTLNKKYTDPAIFGYGIVGSGPEQRLAHRWIENVSSTVYIIKSAIGAYNITHWNPSSGDMWVELTRFIREASQWFQAAGLTPHYRMIGWIQGESDAIEGITAPYAGRLRTFINAVRDLRSELHDVPFVMAKLKPTSVDYSSAINAAFDLMATENPYNITFRTDTLGAPFQNDSLHYTQAGYLALGQAFFELVTGFVPGSGGSTETPTLSDPVFSTPTVISSSQVNLAWGAVTNATGYIVDRSLHNANSWTNTYTGSATSYNNTGLSASTQYDWRAKATATGYNSSGYGTTTATTNSAPQLTAPALTANSTGTTSVGLSWNTPTNTTGFVLDRALNSGFTSGVTNGIYIGSGNSYSDVGLSSSTTYYYHIRGTASGYTPSNYGTANATTDATGGGSFTPADLGSALVSWYSIRDAASLSSGQLSDKSGNAHHLTRSGGTYHSSGGINNQPYLSLASLETLSNSSFSVSQPFVFYWVVKRTSGITYLATMNSSKSVNISVGSNIWGGYTLTAAGGGSAFNTRFQLIDQAVATNELHRVEFNGDNSTLRRNREPRTQKTSGGGTTAMDRIVINGEGTTMDFYELVITNRLLTSTEDANLTNYLHGYYSVTNQPYMVFLGNSITNGVGASVTANQFTSLVASELGFTQYNYGVSGATLHQAIGDVTKGWDTQCLDAASAPSPGTAKVISIIGYNNDFNKNGTGNPVSKAQWQTDLETGIQHLLDAGYSASNIFVFSPIHSLTSYSGDNDEMDEMATYIQAACTNKGVTYGDLLHYSRNHISSYTMPDGIHPGDTGHRLMANYIESVIAGSPLTIVPPIQKVITLNSRPFGKVINLNPRKTGELINMKIKKAS